MVYVDTMKANFGRMKMCHMIADTTGELLAMCDKIGVARKWIQYPGTPREHFDIATGKKALAMKNGAKLVSWKRLGEMTLYRAQHGTLPPYTPEFPEDLLLIDY